MKRINLRRILALVGIFALLFYFVLSWTNMMGDLYQRTGSDFIGLYNFGRIYQAKGIQHIYDIKEQEKIEEQVVGHPVTVIFYTHLPFMAPIAKLVVDQDYMASFKRWAMILLFLNAINVFLLTNTLDWKRYTKENLFILCAGAFLFDPTASGFMNGQDTAILMLGAVLWTWGIFSKRDFLAGLGLSLTTVRPQVALFLAIPFLFGYRKVFWGFVVGAAVLASFSIWLLKVDGTLKFIESIRYIESTIWVEPHSFDMPTISGIIRRNFIVTDPVFPKTFVWMCYLAGIIGFSIWWHKSQQIGEKHIGLITLAGIFLLPYAHYHELTLLLIPIFCVVRMLERQSTVRQDYYVLLPLIVSWISALGFFGSGVMKFPLMYTVMLFLAYLLVTEAKALTRFPALAAQTE
jgi:hypothetical protein